MALAATSASKIVLKETTKMTLHERFSMYRQTNQLALNSVNGRQAMLMNQQASAKNQRLAVQMANRPSVVAALKLKKRSLKQRLGQNAGFNSQRLGYQSNVKSRLSLGGFRERFNPNQRYLNAGQNILRPGTSPMIKARLGVNQNAGSILFAGTRGGFSGSRGGFGGSRGGFIQQRLRKPQLRKGKNRNALRNQLIQQSLTMNRGILFSNRINKASFRAKQARNGGRGRNRGRNVGGNNGRRMKVPTKQDLDNDLDQYMSQVKSNLDAELDSYMSQAGSSMN